MIKEGDVVEAVVDGGRDKRRLPIEYPRIGRIYRIKSIYEMKYGLGCTLFDMDPDPYKGYLLFVKPEVTFARRKGWYFRPAKADPLFLRLMSDIKNNVPIDHVWVDDHDSY